MAIGLIVVLLGGVLGSVLLAVPEAMPALTKLLGIRQEAVIPPRGDELDAPAQSTSGEAPVDNTAAATPYVHFIDVGQGDAVLLEDGGQWALLDAGPPEGEDALLAYLEGAGVTAFRYVIMSHPHADHIGGMEAVLRKYTAEKVLFPDFEKAPYPTTKTFESLLATMVEQGMSAETMKQGAEYELGAGRIRVLQDGLETKDNYNLLSVSLLYTSGALRFLATGDAEKANENALLEGGEALDANLFKAGHHGSSTSNSRDFVQAVSPGLAVISCGQDNSYGHPHRETLSTFAEFDVTVLRTDRDGSVVVWPGEGGLRWSTAAEAANAA